MTTSGLIITIGVVCFVLGFVSGLVILNKEQNEDDNDEYEYDDFGHDY